MGEPDPCRATRNATINVKVFRNERAPVFENEGQYKATINMDLGTNNRVTSVQSEDRDEREPFNSVLYSIIGDDNAPVFFSISEDNGEIRVKNSLQEDTETEYTVSKRHVKKKPRN